MRQWASWGGNFGVVAVVAGTIAVALLPKRLEAQVDAGSSLEFVPTDEVGPPAALDQGVAEPSRPQVSGSEVDASAPVQPAKEPGPVVSAPPTATEEASSASSKAEQSKLSRRSTSKADVLFGSYRIRLMYGRPTFRDQLKYYEALYGKAKDYPQIGIDWFAWDWYATMGIGVRFGYYSDDGNAALVTGSQASDLGNLKASDLTRDPNGSTSLVMVPVQSLFTMEITPFPKKWLVLDGWAGWERLYFQETRNQKQAATRSSGSTTTAAPSSATDKTLTNVGWRNAIVIGAAANILLNAIDEQSTLSLRSIGIGGVYLSPFMEWIKTVGQPPNNTLSFGRTVVGLAFTFETVK